MNENAKAPTLPPVEPPRTKSGQHPAVRDFRRKLESLAEDVDAQSALERRQNELLEQIRTPPPPPPDEDETPKPAEEQ